MLRYLPNARKDFCQTTVKSRVPSDCGTNFLYKELVFSFISLIIYLVGVTYKHTIRLNVLFCLLLWVARRVPTQPGHQRCWQYSQTLFLLKTTWPFCC